MRFSRYRATMSCNHYDIYRKSNSLYHSAKSRAKKYNIDFDLDINWVNNNLVNMKCQLTGLNLTLNYDNTGVVKYNSASIHRLVPELGYIKQNCCIIANSVNMFISNYSITDVLEANKYISDNTENILLIYKNN